MTAAAEGRAGALAGVPVGLTFLAVMARENSTRRFRNEIRLLVVE